MKNSVLMFYFFCGFFRLLAQSHSDCASAIELSLPIDTLLEISSITATDSGKVMEFAAEKTSPYSFDKEHATTWYHLTMPVSGYMTFEIIPNEINSDYDFLLFHDKYENTCEKILKQEIYPLRSIVSRNDSFFRSKTGLDVFSQKTHIPSGPGDSYGRILSIEKGEKYYLIVDNYKQNGTGFRIKFQLYFLTEIRGKVIDTDTKKPLEAKVIIQNAQTQKPVFELLCDKEGNYGEKLLPHIHEKYEILYQQEGYFSDFRQTDFFALTENSQKPINIELKKIKIGASITLENLYYEGGLAVLLPRSQPQLNVLLNLMQHYPTLKIRIEGHANCVGVRDISNVEELSKNRAKVIKDFLVSKGIAENRIETEGYGCQFQLSYTQEEKNRRVEMKVLDF